jgi:probable H4MPT-linked C1 transfer pathway protein
LSATVGLDVGGAHLKVARLGAAGALVAARTVACPLWRGLDRLDQALDEAADDIPPTSEIAVTMTGELVDLWPDRTSGVTAIVAALADRYGAGRLAFYAGAVGFVDRDAASGHVARIASANWRATAEAMALEHESGLLVDVGSTTADIIPVANRRVSARGATDAERMAADELIYLGVARTPVMAMATRLPFAGAWVQPMAEHFATSADVFRLTGDLVESADLHPSADGGPKTPEASARRLLRMVGADLDADTAAAAELLARYLGEASLRRLCDAATAVLSRAPAVPVQAVVGAGVGRFLARRLAERLGLLYRDVAAGWTDDAGLAQAAADSAPAVAVAKLCAMRRAPIETDVGRSPL